MSYAKETPEQRMFDSWLKSHNISQGEYNSMTTDQQQALKNEFQVEMRAKMNEKLGIGTPMAESNTSATAS